VSTAMRYLERKPMKPYGVMLTNASSKLRLSSGSMPPAPLIKDESQRRAFVNDVSLVDGTAKPQTRFQTPSAFRRQRQTITVEYVTTDGSAMTVPILCPYRTAEFVPGQRGKALQFR